MCVKLRVASLLSSFLNDKIFVGDDVREDAQKSNGPFSQFLRRVGGVAKGESVWTKKPLHTSI